MHMAVCVGALQGSITGSAESVPAAATASAPAGAPKPGPQRCGTCSAAIQRHILVCSTCSTAFHLDCMATLWVSTAGSGGGGGGEAGGSRFGGVPESGRCPACGQQHTWMGMLQGMQTVGWGNKPRGRRG